MQAERRGGGDMMMRRYSLNCMGDGGGNRQVCVLTGVTIMPAKLYCGSTSGRDLCRPKFENFTRSGPTVIVYVRCVTLI